MLDWLDLADCLSRSDVNTIRYILNGKTAHARELVDKLPVTVSGQTSSDYMHMTNAWHGLKLMWNILTTTLQKEVVYIPAEQLRDLHDRIASRTKVAVTNMDVIQAVLWSRLIAQTPGKLVSLCPSIDCRSRLTGDVKQYDGIMGNMMINRYLPPPNVTSILSSLSVTEVDLAVYIHQCMNHESLKQHALQDLAYLNRHRKDINLIFPMADFHGNGCEFVDLIMSSWTHFDYLAPKLQRRRYNDERNIGVEIDGVKPVFMRGQVGPYCLPRVGIVTKSYDGQGRTEFWLNITLAKHRLGDFHALGALQGRAVECPRLSDE
jgi:hypothetical protein